MKKIISFLSVMVVFSGFVVLNSWADETEEALCPVENFEAQGCTEDTAFAGATCTEYGSNANDGVCINKQGGGLTCAAVSCNSGSQMWLAKTNKGIMSMGRCHNTQQREDVCAQNCKCELEGDKPACKPRTPTAAELAEANNASYGGRIETLTASNSYICYCDKTTPSLAEQIEEEKPCDLVDNANEMEKDDEGNCKVKKCDEGYEPSDDSKSCKCKNVANASVNPADCTFTCNKGYRESKDGKGCIEVCKYTANLYCKDGTTSVQVEFKEDDFAWEDVGGEYNNKTQKWDFPNTKKLYEYLKSKNQTEYNNKCATIDTQISEGGSPHVGDIRQDPTCNDPSHAEKFGQLTQKIADLEAQIKNQKNGADSTKVNNAQEKLKKFFITLDKNRSVWKNADGSFNAVRLASDLTAGVVLGTVGGVVSGVLIKKSQVEKGFDALHCTVGGQKIADWSDEFRVGLRR